MEGYFEFTEVVDEREANVVASRNGRRMPVLNDMNDKRISEETEKMQ